MGRTRRIRCFIRPDQLIKDALEPYIAELLAFFIKFVAQLSDKLALASNFRILKCPEQVSDAVLMRSRPTPPSRIPPRSYSMKMRIAAVMANLR
ncbi:hypothetical protein PspCFBP13509_27875 [Pseudomonas sp. CFBP13509]|nr:hypothetical protein PspCFBP13509_27875 [Pseudomonas sp. CFBP13509]